MFKKRASKDAAAQKVADDIKALSLLSSAALFEERLQEPSLSRGRDLIPLAPREPADQTASSGPSGRRRAAAGPAVHEADAIEASQFQATAQRANGLLVLLRAEPDALQRAQLVAKHTIENGVLPVRG